MIPNRGYKQKTPRYLVGTYLFCLYNITLKLHSTWYLIAKSKSTAFYIIFEIDSNISELLAIHTYHKKPLSLRMLVKTNAE